MDVLTLLGLLAGSLTTIAFVPQVIKIWRSKSAKDLSFSMLITFCLGVFLWLIYGLYLNSLPVILANAVTLLLSLVNLGLKVKYESSRF